MLYNDNDIIGYHVTTPKKLERYQQTGCILQPVRFWPNLLTAKKWLNRTGRSIILRISCKIFYPLPDHRPACWTPENIYDYKIVYYKKKY